MPVNPQTGQPVPASPYKAAPLPYDNSKILSQHAFKQAVSALKAQRADTMSYYGLSKKGRPDPFNVYGAYQMMGREHGQQLTDLTNAQFQSGLGGFGQRGMRGLALGQQNQARFGQGFDQQRMLKEFQDKMNAITLGRREAKWQKGRSETSGTLQAIINAISAGQFTPAAPVY